MSSSPFYADNMAQAVDYDLNGRSQVSYTNVLAIHKLILQTEYTGIIHLSVDVHCVTLYRSSYFTLRKTKERKRCFW